MKKLSEQVLMEIEDLMEAEIVRDEFDGNYAVQSNDVDFELIIERGENDTDVAVYGEDVDTLTVAKAAWMIFEETEETVDISLEDDTFYDEVIESLKEVVDVTKLIVVRKSQTIVRLQNN